MELDQVLQKQRDYFKSGHTLPPAFRVKQLRKLKRSVLKHQEEIVESIHKDFGKSEFEVLGTEIFLTLKEIQLAIKRLKRWAEPKRVTPGLFSFPSRDYIHYEPYGSVLIISPWNFPFNLAFIPLVGAIAAGNTISLKASEYTSNTTDVMEKIIKEVFDPEYITVIKGGPEVGAQLIKMRYDMIFFTGSTRVGKEIMKAASENLTPVVLELGGKSPCIVHYGADLDLAAKKIAWGKFLNSGQTCVAPDYIMVQEEAEKEFVERLQYHLKKMMGEHPEKNTDYARLIHKKAFDRQVEFLKDGEILIGGKHDESILFMEPTVIKVEGDNVQSMKEEIFGPIMPLMTYKNLEGAIEFVRERHRPLVFYFFSSRKRLQDLAIKQIPSGDACINDTVVHFGSSQLPVGGLGQSGIGKYHGKASFKAFSHEKSVVRKINRPDIPLRYPPYGNRANLIRKFIKLWF